MSSNLSSLQQMLTNQTGSLTDANSGTTTNSNSGSQATNYNPIFLGAQTGLQGNASDIMGQIMSGNTGQYGLNNAAYQTAMTNFNNVQAPQLAAQYGAGSPAINSAQQQLQVALAGQSSQLATGNAINAFNAAAQYGFNPVATNSSQTNSGTSTATSSTNDNQNTNQTNTDVGGLLSGIAGTALSGISGLFGP